ncbi:F-box protein At5g07610-like [Morus notabilis]|uniref:F-box protein At5g07610-like n=1 Tax=Morus notabilis TaxID=981085 RepID=UPI000CECF308|nr:F-box protein At5g07610-like [Morus notabilis]
MIADNDDLLNEILLHLPIKSLIKFKSVSKHWLSLISDPNFSRRRNPSFPTSASAIFFRIYSESGRARPEYNFIDLSHNSNPSRPPFRSLTFVDNKPGIGICHSCNGLLLCCASSPNRERREYYVYNPTTKQYTILPPLIFPRGNSRAVIKGLTLAFDPSKSPHYKVVCVRNSDAQRGQFQVEIYSSETGPWRLCSNLGSFPAQFSTQFNDGVFWNGAVHWFCPSGTSLYFKVDEERLGEIPMLPVPDDFDPLNRMLAYFGESRDHLHFVDHIHESGEVRLNVYEMERDYSGWFVKYRVDLSRVSTAFPELIPSSLFDQLTSQMQYHLFSVLCVVRVLRYNFESTTLYNLRDTVPAGMETILHMSLVGYVHQYIESLACV